MLEKLRIPKSKCISNSQNSLKNDYLLDIIHKFS